MNEVKRSLGKQFRILSGVVMGLLIIWPQTVLAVTSSQTSFHSWHGAGLLHGQHDHAQPTYRNGRMALTLSSGANNGSWTSPVYHSPVPIGNLVASWQATTPAGSWIETRLSVKAGGHWSRWYSMGQWAFDNAGGPRTSVQGQSDADGVVYTDTYVPGINGAPTAYRLQVMLHGTPEARPLVYQLAATTSSDQPTRPVSPTTMKRTIELAVPQFSQEIHAGEYPAYDGGGESWCSPTSTAMVMRYWGRGPSAADLATLTDPVFVAHGRIDGEVNWAALHTWDAAYAGTGNWPFNTAYASAYGLDGSVRQYSSLTDIEQWIKRGVPVITSIAWDNTDTEATNDLTGAFIAKTNGHLMVVRGFTARGEVIVNDPAAPNNASVRHIYQRAEFERNWQTASNGATYIIKPL